MSGANHERSGTVKAIQIVTFPEGESTSGGVLALGENGSIYLAAFLKDGSLSDWKDVRPLPDPVPTEAQRREQDRLLRYAQAL